MKNAYEWKSIDKVETILSKFPNSEKLKYLYTLCFFGITAILSQRTSLRHNGRLLLSYLLMDKKYLRIIFKI